MTQNNCDILVIGGGIFGIYTALYFSEKGYKVTILEKDTELMSKGTSNNQLRIHNGYHYPRSLYTSLNSNKYFKRFSTEFHHCINDQFQSIYCVSKKLSLCDSQQFENFCNSSKIHYEKTSFDFINYKEIESSYITEEYVYDTQLLKQEFLKRLNASKVIVKMECSIKGQEKNEQQFTVFTNQGNFSANTVINATYSSINSVNDLFGFKPHSLKYELCEIVVCKLDPKFRDFSITVMDGPFFSLMPDGKTGYHTLSSVRFTPHKTSTKSDHNFDDLLAEYEKAAADSKAPVNSNFEFMKRELQKFTKGIDVEFISSRYSIKPILTVSEISDSRPTLIHKHNSKPNFYSILSGKVNTIFDVESIDFDQ